MKTTLRDRIEVLEKECAALREVVNAEAAWVEGFDKTNCGIKQALKRRQVAADQLRKIDESKRDANL